MEVLMIVILLAYLLQSYVFAYHNKHPLIIRRNFKAHLSVEKVEILKQIGEWACVKSCGACCKLGPLESRPDLEDYLSKENVELYKSMIGPDDWCRHFDKTNRLCTVYESRPSFCRVDKGNFKLMYDIDEEDFEDFCTFCCKENIADVYGENSKEMENFDDAQLDAIDGISSIIIDPKEPCDLPTDNDQLEMD